MKKSIKILSVGILYYSLNSQNPNKAMLKTAIITTYCYRHKSKARIVNWISLFSYLNLQFHSFPCFSETDTMFPFAQVNILSRITLKSFTTLLKIINDNFVSLHVAYPKTCFSASSNTFSPCHILHSPIKAALFSNSIRISVFPVFLNVSPFAF